ncbi:MAG TPA: hypothetical protein VNV62_27995 [Trebonia sp.]|jgi:hypothetical protein|nr:hypothetical protein [Trebonia sp.]
MTAFVSPERATAASLTGAIGLLILGLSIVMMVIAAPAHIHYGAHNPVKPSAAQLTTDLCHQLTAKSGSTTVYACLTGPWAPEHASAF